MIEDILAERKKTHGLYDDDARVAMALLQTIIMEAGRVSTPLSDVQFHSLAMITFKIARIVAGDPNFKDHWDDIAGYAKLVADRCERNERFDDEVMQQTTCPKELLVVQEAADPYSRLANHPDRLT